MQIVAVVGSRTFNNKKLLFDTLDNLEKPFTLVSGGARGADKLAEGWARSRGVKIEVFKPDWNRFGKAGGFVRNKLIIDKASCVIACWDGVSKGTKHSIDLANKAGIPVKVIWS